jgi:hypothetical protein
LDRREVVELVVEEPLDVVEGVGEGDRRWTVVVDVVALESGERQEEHRPEEHRPVEDYLEDRVVQGLLG